MSVVSINRRKIGMNATRAVGSREYEVTYIIKVSDPADTVATVFAHPDLPTQGNIFDLDPLAICTEVTVTAMEGTHLAFEAVVRYTASSTASEAAEEPEARETTYTWGTETRQEIFTVDADGVAILNSAKDPFVPAVETTINDLTLTVTRNEVAFDAEAKRNLLNRVNSEAFTVAGYAAEAQEALMRKITGVSKTELGVRYYEVTYELVFRKHDPAFLNPAGVVVIDNAWTLRLLDQGLNYISAAGPPIVTSPILGEDGQPITQPVLLDGAGQKGDRSNPKWLAFREYKTANFIPLAL